ncbi:MAG: hypothetical protein HZB36_05740 [Candidatus Omnitrophica bacterium]|nr:hypothetical protein [Candidatus Omnitrophota bacterium]
MHDIFIYRLVTCFTISIIIWALFAYTELWINHNMSNTAKIIAKLLHTKSDHSSQDPPDYLLIQGFYKNRKIVCRMSHFSPSRFLHYNLRMHIHIEPLLDLRSERLKNYYVTENTRLEANNKINYECTSLTAIKSYFLSSMINKDEFIQIFEELTRAAEMVESQTH